MKRSRTGVALVVGFAALALGACGPAGVQDTGRGGTTTSAVAAAPSSAEGSTTPAPSTTAPSPSPSSSSPSARPTTAAPHTTRPASRAPAVLHTTAPPVHRTTAPPVHRTTAPPRTALCSIRSAAGNCYKAGQFCRKADLGRTTTDAAGRAITCEIVSGRPHWHY